MENCVRAMSAFISCSPPSSSRTFSLRVTPCNSGISLVGPVRLSRSSHVTGWAGLDFQPCSSNSKDGVLLGKRWTWMQRGKQCCLFLLLVLCLAISARAIPIPQCDPCKRPSCRPGGDSDLVAPVCEDLLQEMLIYKGTVVILYSSGVPVMVCLLMAWTFWKAPRD